MARPLRFITEGGALVEVTTRTFQSRLLLTPKPLEPNRTKKSPAPRFHAVRKWVRQELYQTYTLFAQAYREAAEMLRLGNRNAPFPRGCFPPPLPFVG